MDAAWNTLGMYFDIFGKLKLEDQMAVLGQIIL
jgi:hypothetical protein